MIRAIKLIYHLQIWTSQSVITLWHKIITYEKSFWNNYFWKITNFIRNSLKKSFFPGDFEGAKPFAIISCQRVSHHFSPHSNSCENNYMRHPSASRDSFFITCRELLALEETERAGLAVEQRAAQLSQAAVLVELVTGEPQSSPAIAHAACSCSFQGSSSSISQNCLQWGRSSLVVWPRRVAENSFTKPGFWERLVEIAQEKQQNTEFTKFSLVRTPEIY